MLTDEEGGPLQYEIDTHNSLGPPQSIIYVLGCSSNHNNYVPVKDFNLNHLPEDIQNIDLFKLIILNINLAVMVSVRNTKATINDSMHTSASGSICYFSETHDLYPCNHDNIGKCQQCHIPNCLYLDTFGEGHFMVTSLKSYLSEDKLKRAHLAFRVSTNQHVVKDTEAAKNTTVHLFYHSEDKTDTLTAKVVNLCESWEEQDKVHLVCVMDMNLQVQTLLQTMRDGISQLFSLIPPNIIERFIQDYVVVISHPHGTQKVVSIGRTIKCVQKKGSNDQWYMETRYEVETCKGCSGAPVIGPGWSDGGPCYRVHCGFCNLSKTKKKLGVSKSHWIVNSDARGGILLCSNEPGKNMSEFLSTLLPSRCS